MVQGAPLLLCCSAICVCTATEHVSNHLYALHYHLIFTRQQQQPQQCACSDGCLLPGTLGRQIQKKLLIVWVCPQIATSIAEPCDIVLCALLTRAHGYQCDGRQRGSVRPCRCNLDNDLNLLLMDIIFSLMTSVRLDGVLNVRQS